MFTGNWQKRLDYIVMDTEIHGNDIITSLKTAAITYPSDKFRDLLDSLINVVETGGDLETFFASMVIHYQNYCRSRPGHVS